MQSFEQIYTRASKRKGGDAQLSSILPTMVTNESLAALGDDRYLAAMTKSINQAGFHWQVIENKWPQFEEAFFDFNIAALLGLSDARWDAYMQDTRVVRHWQKICAVRENAVFISQESQAHGSFGQLIAMWPKDDQIGLQKYLKLNGNRLGGMTGPLFLRRLGADVYMLSSDVVLALKHAGLDVDDNPTSQRDLKLIQATLNEWHTQFGLPYSHLSKILAYSAGDNNPVEKIAEYMSFG